MKERIINCSIELFGRYGIKGVTMGAIASELGISKRTLYEHFTCKKQLLEECMHSRLDQHRLFVLTGKSLIDELIALYTGMWELDLRRARRFCRELRKFYVPVYVSSSSNCSITHRHIVNMSKRVFRKDISVEMCNRQWFVRLFPAV